MLGGTTMRTSWCLVADLLLAFVARYQNHTLILPRPAKTRNSGRAEQWIARCGWVPRRGARGCPYEGHVPHTGRARTQEVAEVSKSVGSLVMRETHQPLKS